jgi:hypothetical protein
MAASLQWIVTSTASLPLHWFDTPTASLQVVDTSSYALQVVGTSSVELNVYAALHVSQLPDIQLSREIRPAHVMLETPRRSWVPLCFDKEEAVKRALWGYEEMRGLDCSRSDIVVVEINFTAYGAAYFLLKKTLTQLRCGRFYRFHGTIPFLMGSHDGQFLLQVGDITASD